MEKEYSIEPAFTVYNELIRSIIKASISNENKWFFTNGSFFVDAQIEVYPNTWKNDNFVVLSKNRIIAYFEATWEKPLNNVKSFRLILFEKKRALIATKAFFDYLDYIFTVRGCNGFNWIVAEKNIHAYKLYEKFISKYCGHKIGLKHYGQMAYDGEISDVILYEITKEEYFAWKNSKYNRN